MLSVNGAFGDPTLGGSISGHQLKEKMSMNLYVGNLSYRTTDQELKEMFDSYGEVGSARIISDRETGRSRGFGFVEMTNSEEGQSAIKALHDSEYQGRRLVVNEARPRDEQSGGGRGGRGGRSGGAGFDRGDKGERGGFDRGGDRGGKFSRGDREGYDRGGHDRGGRGGGRR